MIQTWRANCDIQLIIDYHACVEYLAKYASKAEKMSAISKEILLYPKSMMTAIYSPLLKG